MQSFSERMAEGKARAADRRSKGETTGRPAKGWRTKTTQPRKRIAGLDDLEAYYHEWKKDVHISAYCAVEWELFKHEWEGLVP